MNLPATGSGKSVSTVVTNEEINVKTDTVGMVLRPVFSILNPQTTYSLSQEQASAGLADIIAHVLERHFTNTKDLDLTDRLFEAALRNLKKYGPIVLKDPINYVARSEIMWAGTIAHNGILGVPSRNRRRLDFT